MEPEALGTCPGVSNMSAHLVSLLLAQSMASGLPAALALEGTPYSWGGRLRPSGPGIDCLGVVFAAAERASGCGWKSYSVNPTELAASGVLGRPVRGLSPIASAALDTSVLEPGDVLFLLSTNENSAEPALTSLDGVSLWVWHTGLALGGGRWVVGDHFAMATVVTDLRAYLDEHPSYTAVYVLRGPVVKPTPCRRHPPLVKRRA